MKYSAIDHPLIIGAITGDIIGSVYEHNNIKRTDFPLFQSRSDYTDDSVLTIATMDYLMNGKDITQAYQEYGNADPNRGYGMSFYDWLKSRVPQPYNSWGNGSAMRVSPVGWAFETLEEVLEQAKRSAKVSHDHPEGIKGAQATAAAVFMAHKGESKENIRSFIQSRFDYDLDRTVEGIRPNYEFDVSCQGSLPEAIIAFLDSQNFEDAIRLAVSLGGDSDTIACISGSIAEAFYGGVPEEIEVQVWARIPEQYKSIIKEFSKKFRNN